MTLQLELSPKEEAELAGNALREGVSLSEYARRRLMESATAKPAAPNRPFHIMQFAAAAPRSTEEIEAHIAEIESARDSWDAPATAER